MAFVRRPAAFWEELRNNRRKMVQTSADLIAHAQRIIQFSEARVDASDRVLRERRLAIDLRQPPLTRRWD